MVNEKEDRNSWIKLFKPAHMDLFRNPDFDSMNQLMRSGVENNWLVFVYKILPLVNEEWNRVLKDNHIQEQPNIYDYTSLSDEVFARWVINCKYDKLMEEAKDGWPERDADKKGKKEGPHESRVLLKSYCEEYSKIKKSFLMPNKVACKLIQEKWNDMFWSRMQSVYPEKFESKELKKKPIKIEMQDLPGMDEDW